MRPENVGQQSGKAQQYERAALYARMSTEYQKYSIDNQEELIVAYAALHNFTIVRKYVDPGRSGLRLEGRDGLRRLIDDIQDGRADFSTVLVYDISRWGRFQDTDESAHYEFICKRAGVTVRYCAEQFENDGGLIATIVKGIKRAMAAEFSRELSFKVLEGQKRISRLGFRRGASPGYGLRRMLVDEERRPKQILEFGQEKYVKTDRVILVPGPPHEIRTVHDIFCMFVHERIMPLHIAKFLNGRSIVNARGNPWTLNNVLKVLRNESYIGNLVYNRTTSKLLSKKRPNPPDMWIRAEGASEKIIDPRLFRSAQNILDHPWAFTDNELLDYLTALLCVNCRLSSPIIRARKCGPSITTYYNRFRFLSSAFRAIGYTVNRKYPFVGDPLYISKRRKQRRSRAYKIWKHSEFNYRA